MKCTFHDCEEEAEEEGVGFCPKHFERARDLDFMGWLYDVFASEHPFLFNHWRKQNTPRLAKEWVRATTGREPSG